RHTRSKRDWSSDVCSSDLAKGQPIKIPGMAPSAPPGVLISPGNQGGTNWYSPSFSPRTGLFYIPTWANYRTYYIRDKVEYIEGRSEERRVGKEDRTREMQ